MDEELKNQHALESELLGLTGVLKDITVNINRTVLEQNMVLQGNFQLHCCLLCIILCMMLYVDIEFYSRRSDREC